MSPRGGQFLPSRFPPAVAATGVEGARATSGTRVDDGLDASVAGATAPLAVLVSLAGDDAARDGRDLVVVAEVVLRRGALRAALADVVCVRREAVLGLAVAAVDRTATGQIALCLIAGGAERPPSVWKTQPSVEPGFGSCAPGPRLL